MSVLQYKNSVIFWKRPCPWLLNVTCSVLNMHCAVQGKSKMCITICYIILTISALLILFQNNYKQSVQILKGKFTPMNYFQRESEMLYNTCKDICQLDDSHWGKLNGAFFGFPLHCWSLLKVTVRENKAYESLLRLLHFLGNASCSHEHSWVLSNFPGWPDNIK